VFPAYVQFPAWSLKLKLSKELLEPLVKQGWGLLKISQHFGTTQADVRHWMLTYGLEKPPPLFRVCPLCLKKHLIKVSEKTLDLELSVQDYLKMLPEELVKSDEALVTEVLRWLSRNNALTVSK